MEQLKLLKLKPNLLILLLIITSLIQKQIYCDNHDTDGDVDGEVKETKEVYRELRVKVSPQRNSWFDRVSGQRVPTSIRLQAGDSGRRAGQ